MPTFHSLADLLADQIKDLFSAEEQLVNALPEMVRGAREPALRIVLESHLEETEWHIERLQTIGRLTGNVVGGHQCKAMGGLIRETEEMLSSEGEPEFQDLALITMARKIEHYEMSGYASARELAFVLGLDEVAEMLKETLDEENRADLQFADLAEEIMSGAVHTLNHV